MTLTERLARQPPKASLATPLRGLADMAARPLNPRYTGTHVPDFVSSALERT